MSKSGKSDAAQETMASAKLREHLKRETDAEASQDAGMFVDDDVAEVVSFLDSVSDEFERSTTRRTIATRQTAEFVRRCVEDGNVSGMQHVAGYVDNRMSQDEAVPYLVDQLRKGGSTVYLWGSQGSGKTYGALWFVDLVRMYVPDIDVAVTNVPVDDEVVDLHIPAEAEVEVVLDGEVVDDLEDLCGVDRDRVSLVVDGVDRTDDVLDLVADSPVEGLDDPSIGVVHVGREFHARAVSAVVPSRCMLVVDEWGTKGGGHKGSNPNAGEHMVRFLKEIRHEPYRSTCVAIGHSPTDLERDGRVLLDIGVEKISRTVGKIYRTVKADGGDDMVADVEIGKHRIPYNDEGATPWVFEGDLDDEEDETDDRLDADEVERLMLEERAVTVWDKGGSYSDIKEATGRSQGWVADVLDKHRPDRERRLVDGNE